MLWLGKISFSLYLNHEIVLHVCFVRFGLPGLIVAVPLCFAVASVLCRVVEQPSVNLSRHAVHWPVYAAR